MKSTTERAAEALDLLPGQLRDVAVAHPLEQAEKLRVLATLVAEGVSDIEAGRVSDRNFEELVRKARSLRPERP